MQHDTPGPPAVTASNPDETVIGYEDDIYDVPSTTAGQSPDEIVLENEIETVVPLPLAPHETKFLALDKCLSRFQFLEAGPCSFLVVREAYASIFLSLQVVDIPTKEEEPSGEEHATVILSYDPKWLAITRAFQPYLSRKRERAAYPDQEPRAQPSRASESGCTSMCCRNSVLSSVSTRANGSRKKSMPSTVCSYVRDRERRAMIVVNGITAIAVVRWFHLLSCLRG